MPGILYSSQWAGRCPQNCPPARFRPPPKTSSLEPLKSTAQTASRLLQTFQHSWWLWLRQAGKDSIFKAEAENSADGGRDQSTETETETEIQNYGLRDQSGLETLTSLELCWSSGLHLLDKQADTQTDHATSLAIGCIYALHACKCTQCTDVDEQWLRFILAAWRDSLTADQLSRITIQPQTLHKQVHSAKGMSSHCLSKAK